MLEGIGRIGDYTAMQNLKLQAKTKLKTGKSLEELSRDLIRQQTEDNLQKTKNVNTQDTSKETRLSIIQQKLRQGKELSASDLKFLKENDEELYSKAKKAQQVRADLELALKRAKTKAEAQRAVMNAQMQVATEAQLEAKNGSVSAASFQSSAAGQTAIGVPTVQTASAAAGTVASEVSGETGNVPTDGTGNAADAPQAESRVQAENERATEEPQEAEAALSQAQQTREERLAEKQANREAGLAQLDSAKKAKSPIEEKYLYQFAAIQDEWRQYTKTSDYENLPESEIDVFLPEEEKKRTSTKKPYRPRSLAHVEAAEAYRTTPLPAIETGQALDYTAE